MLYILESKRVNINSQLFMIVHVKLINKQVNDGMIKTTISESNTHRLGFVNTSDK